MNNLQATKFDSNNQVVAYKTRHVVVKRSVQPAYCNSITVLSYNASNSTYYVTVDSFRHSDIIEFTVLKSTKGGHYDEQHAIRLFNTMTSND